MISKPHLFPLGIIAVTPGAIEAITGTAIFEMIDRHVRGDWGVVDAEDGYANNDAIMNGNRILSAYPIDPEQPCKGWGDNCIWIITEADRSSTTVLLPEEY